MKEQARKTTALLAAMLFLGVALVAGGCLRDDPPPDDTPDDPTTPTAPTTIVEANAAYLLTGKSPVMKADALYDLLNDENTTNDPFVLDIRSAESYMVAHVPGSVNIGFRNVFDDLSLLPTDKQIIVVCYTGHTASQITALLNVAGFDALALKWGFNSWNGEAADHTFSVDQTNEYPVVTGADPGEFVADAARCGEEEDPADDGGDGGEDDTPPEVDEGLLGDIQLAAYDYLKLGKSPIMTASSLYENLADGNDSNDPYVLDIREADAYAAGHIGGSINIGYRAVFDETNFDLLPTDKQIVVVCYTGHTASQTAAMLNIAGLDATALKWAFVSWNYALGGSKAFNASSDAHDYAYESSGYNLREAAYDFTNAGKPAVVTADSLNTTLNDGDDSNDPFILDIRSSDKFNVSRIPSSVNIPFRSVFTEDNLALLPTDKQIVVVCYTGHTASQTMALLNVAGYDATALKFGFEGWSPGGKAFSGPLNGTLSTEVATSDVTTSPSELLVLDIAAAANTFYEGSPSVVVSASSLDATLNDGDDSNDPFILDIRSAEKYAAGHVPGAIHIPYSSVFTAENFSLLPSDKQIVVVCYTGHTASQITALLGLNGLDAVALKWGFEGWSDGGKAFTAPLNGELEYGVSVRAKANEYLALNKSPVITASSLAENLDDGNESNDPFIIDVRSLDKWAAGHIAGAINIPVRKVFSPDNLALLPTDQQIVVVCYTGHSASQATAMLNLAGYDAVALKFGFEGWSDGGSAFTGPYNGTLETTNSTSDVTEGPVDVLAASMADAANTYFGLGKGMALSSSSLDENLNDGDPSNDPFILDIRSSEKYQAGHIPGAVHIDFRSVFTEENFALLPSDKQIVVVCYTGHTASQTAAMLNMAGLDAIALKWGFEGWSDGGKAFNGTYGGDLELGYNLRAVADSYLALGKSPAISSSSLYERFNDTNTSNDPFILDIRSSDTYNVSHIPTAVNIGFRSVFTEENFATLPTDKQIVVVCYTGHTASQITAMLNMAGLDAIALKWGFEGWSDGGKAFTGPHNGTLETTVNTADTFGVAEVGTLSVREAANAFLALSKSPAITASTVDANLNDDNVSNDPFILDIRSAEKYQAGHVPGAVNIGYTSVFTADNYSLLPNDKQIVVVCYTGHTASQITAMLGMMGFDAIALKWGFEGWSDGGKSFSGTYDGQLATGNEPGTWS